ISTEVSSGRSAGSRRPGRPRRGADLAASLARRIQGNGSRQLGVIDHEVPGDGVPCPGMAVRRLVETPALAVQPDTRPAGLPGADRATCPLEDDTAAGYCEHADR